MVKNYMQNLTDMATSEQTLQAFGVLPKAKKNKDEGLKLGEVNNK